MHQLSLRELIQALQTQQISSTELTQHYLKRIQEQNKTLNAFVHLDEELSLTAAKHADHLLKTQRGQLLTGIPIAHKDIFCTQDMPTTCCSKMLKNFQSPYEATLVQRLRAQGTVLLGKTNMDEFAMGSSNETSYFGEVKNPWNLLHSPGGSSGGSSASVAAGLTPFATASDTGGSTRQPAAFCNITGLKATYGTISRFGMVAYASSLDQPGIMAHSAEDLALILPTVTGLDEQDSTSIDNLVAPTLDDLKQPIRGLRIGLPDFFHNEHIEPDIQQAILQAIDFFKHEGAEIIPLNLPMQHYWVPCYYVISCAEASSNLSRYDGIRFGHHTEHANNLREFITHSRSEGFGTEVKRRILTGTYILSSGHFDAYYMQAQKVRRLIQNELLNTFNQVDIILGPTTLSCAFKLGEQKKDPVHRYLSDIFTVAANLAGLPAMSLPVGFNQNNLPIGMQLMGKPLSETRLLHLAHYYQQHTEWHKRWPSEGDKA